MKVKRIQFGAIDIDDDRFSKMFKNKEKEIVFYNPKNNTYR